MTPLFFFFWRSHKLTLFVSCTFHSTQCIIPERKKEVLLPELLSTERRCSALTRTCRFPLFTSASLPSSPSLLSLFPPSAPCIMPPIFEKNRRLLNPSCSEEKRKTMGCIRTKTVKRASRQVVEKYYSKLNYDFYQNKRVILDVTVAQSKKLKNKIAGYTTHIMRRLARGPVRGISLKLQEEERERRMDHAPAVSDVDKAIQAGVSVDKKTMQMLSRLEIGVPRRVKRAEAAAAKAVVAPRRKVQKKK